MSNIMETKYFLVQHKVVWYVGNVGYLVTKRFTHKIRSFILIFKLCRGVSYKPLVQSETDSSVTQIFALFSW